MSRQCGFVQRKSKITGYRFVDLLIFNHQFLTSQSLNDLCVKFNERYDENLTKQGINERFNEKAITFLKSIIERLLSKQFWQKSLKIRSSENFSQVLIKDSTAFQVDESLASEFPGSGGGASKAAIRIQFEYDLLTGKVKDLSIHAFNDQDITNAMETLHKVKKGTLLVRDLGYIKKDVMEGVSKRKAYFVNRLHPNQTVFEELDGQRKKMDFEKVYNYMSKNKIDRMTRTVYLSETSNIPLRLIIELAPEKCVNERMRKANKNAQKKGRKIRKSFKSRTKLTLFLTNTSDPQIKETDLVKIYRLRWQIELIFKVWKSICGIHQVKKVQANRLLAYIYARLIFILISWQFYWTATKRAFYEESKFLSFFKAAKTLYQNILILRDLLIIGVKSMDDYFNHFYEQSLKFHLLEKRLKKPTSLEMIIQLNI